MNLVTRFTIIAVFNRHEINMHARLYWCCGIFVWFGIKRTFSCYHAAAKGEMSSEFEMRSEGSQLEKWVIMIIKIPLLKVQKIHLQEDSKHNSNRLEWESHFSFSAIVKIELIKTTNRLTWKTFIFPVSINIDLLMDCEKNMADIKKEKSKTWCTPEKSHPTDETAPCKAMQCLHVYTSYYFFFFFYLFFSWVENNGLLWKKSICKFQK